MSNFNPTEHELLKSLLEPLLEDFQYWFSRSKTLLESERVSFLSIEEQTDLLERVKRAQQEVNAAKILFKATEGQAGIDTAAMVPWHKLLMQCWQVAMRWRTFKQENDRATDQS